LRFAGGLRLAGAFAGAFAAGRPAGAFPAGVLGVGLFSIYLIGFLFLSRAEIANPAFILRD